MYGKNFDLKKEGIIEKIFYERRAYESVDDRKPLLGYISKINGKQNPGTNGLRRDRPKHFLSVAPMSR